MSEQRCFHCGLPIMLEDPPRLDVFDHPQEFCCHGCQVVCEVIINAGNSDYYKHRDTTATPYNASKRQKELENLILYDNEKIQDEFIRSSSQGEWKEVWLILEDIRCAACLWLNEHTLRGMEGVLDVYMDYTGQQARVRWDPSKLKLSEILLAISRIGYLAHPFDPTQREALDKEQKDRSIQRILFALILGMAVMQSAIGSYFFGDVTAQGELPLWLKISRWVNVFSTLLLLAYPGQIFFKSAWRDLKNKTLGMDVPIVIGLSVAWLGSFYNTLRGTGEVYFESIAMFVIFLLIARYIELKSRIEATSLLDRAAKIIPQSILKYGATGLQQVAVAELKQGDHIQLKPGETLPVDGCLLTSASSFDESLLTGESKPVMHKVGDHLLGGSINIDQTVDIEVLSTQHASTLDEIQQLTHKSTQFRPHYVDLAEKVAIKFVAIILGIASLTFFYWYWHSGFNDINSALSHTIAVLIVTCPCALALAAPVALSLAAAGLNKFHLLPVRMSAIEKIHQLNTLVLDKTGTITTGKPKLESIASLGLLSENHCVAIAAAIEAGSSHPFAYAIQQYDAQKCKKLGGVYSKKLSKRQNFPGKGVQVHLGESIWRLGNQKFVCELLKTDVLGDFLPLYDKKINAWRKNGHSVLFLANEEAIQAIFYLCDPVRPGIKPFIASLKNSGVANIIILSGDHQQSVNAIGLDLGVNKALGNLSPSEKLQKVRQLQQQHENRVMMIGDGINDSPTLAVADISFTFSDATDLAKHNSDFIILKKDYVHLAQAFRLMRQTRKIIVQNLWWAVAYNVFAIPLAVIGWVTPWMAAIGMSLSSILVVLNSLRIKRYYPDRINDKNKTPTDDSLRPIESFKKSKNPGGCI